MDRNLDSEADAHDGYRDELSKIWSDAKSHPTQAIAAAVGLVYTSGFLVNGSHYSKIGVDAINFVSTKHLSSGLIYLFFLAWALFFIVYSHPSKLGRAYQQQKHLLENSGKITNPRLMAGVQLTIDFLFNLAVASYLFGIYCLSNFSPLLAFYAAVAFSFIWFRTGAPFDHETQYLRVKIITLALVKLFFIAAVFLPNLAMPVFLLPIASLAIFSFASEVLEGVYKKIRW